MNGQKLGVPNADLPSLENVDIADCNEHMFSKATMKCINCGKCAHEFLEEIQTKQNENMANWTQLR